MKGSLSHHRSVHQPFRSSRCVSTSGSLVTQVRQGSKGPLHTTHHRSIVGRSSATAAAQPFCGSTSGCGSRTIGGNGGGRRASPSRALVLMLKAFLLVRTPANTCNACILVAAWARQMIRSGAYTVWTSLQHGCFEYPSRGTCMGRKPIPRREITAPDAVKITRPRLRCAL